MWCPFFLFIIMICFLCLVSNGRTFVEQIEMYFFSIFYYTQETRFPKSVQICFMNLSTILVLLIQKKKKKKDMCFVLYTQTCGLGGLGLDYICFNDLEFIPSLTALVTVSQVLASQVYLYHNKRCKLFLIRMVILTGTISGCEAY